MGGGHDGAAGDVEPRRSRRLARKRRLHVRTLTTLVAALALTALVA
jgi:hypothetical protein